MRRVTAVVAFLVLAVVPASGGGASPDRTVVRSAAAAPVAAPRLVRNISTGETGWFSSPGLVDLNGDHRLEIVAPLYSTFVFDAKGRQLGKGTATKGRVYAPGTVADLDGDGRKEIVVGGNEGTVAAYELRAGQLRPEPGWPASTCSGGQCPEARGLAAADLDGDGSVEVVVTTTNTSPTGAQVFVFNARGSLYRPKGAPATAWPRYNRLRGKGNDADFNGVGNHGYGAYGENVGIGNLDDDAQLEIVVTFDNHQINVFNHDGTSVLASPWFRNRDSRHAGRRLGWGQFIRWLDPAVEARHYHDHTGPWPDVKTTMWLQWTDSPPSVADLDRDGRNEVVGVPNAEQKEPYETQAYAFMVLDGAHGDGSRSALRHAGFTNPPRSGKPAVRPPGDWYPPSGIPAPTIVDLSGDRRPEIVASVPDGFVYAVGPTGTRLWRFDYAKGAPKTFASEVVAADLNRDGKPELVFGTFALAPGSGRLVVLSAAGKRLHDIRLPRQGRNGNGIGVPAAPSIGDLDGDGALEIVLLTFDHGIDVFRVPGSGTNLLPWPTGRGSLLRNGSGPATAP
jgi:VCBS repeat protein